MASPQQPPTTYCPCGIAGCSSTGPVTERPLPRYVQVSTPSQSLVHQIDMAMLRMLREDGLTDD